MAGLNGAALRKQQPLADVQTEDLQLIYEIHLTGFKLNKYTLM